MIENLEIKRFSANQYHLDGCSFYDTDLLVNAATLAEDIKSKLGVDILVNNDVIERAKYYRGKQVNGNNHYPQRMFIKSTWGDKWELLTQYDFSDVKDCYTTYGSYTKEQIIEIAKCIIDYVNTHDVLTEGFYASITYCDMPYICDGYSVALELIRYYKPFVDIKQGVADFLKIVNPNYPLDKSKLSADLLAEFKSYGLIPEK